MRDALIVIPARFASSRYPGKPLARGPFLFGLVGGLGVLTAIAIAQMVVNSLSTIILVVVAMFLAVGLNPAVEALQRRGLARRAAISIVFIGVIVAFVLFVLLVAYLRATREPT